MILLEQSMLVDDVRGNQATLNEEAFAPPSQPIRYEFKQFSTSVIELFW